MCPDCKHLLEIASEANRRHIAVLSNLQIAHIQQDDKSVWHLHVMKERAAEHRRLSTQAYKSHLDSHSLRARAS